MISVGLGSSLGAFLRYLITIFWKRCRIDWPLATLLINVTGSFLLGVVTKEFAANTPIFQLFGTGVLGGYTTFSTFNTELISMLDEHRWLSVTCYLILSYSLGIMAAVAGIVL